MTHDWEEVNPADEEGLRQEFSSKKRYRTAIEDGAQVYHCTNGSQLDLGALRIILGGRPVVPKVQQVPINVGSISEQTAVAAELSGEIPELAQRHNSDIKKLKESMQKAMDKKVEELRRELEEEKRRAREEADGLKKCIAEMQLEEIIRKEMERRAREEADGLRKRIAEMQSKLEEDRHRSGKASATYLNSRHVPSHLI